MLALELDFFAWHESGHVHNACVGQGIDEASCVPKHGRAHHMITSPRKHFHPHPSFDVLICLGFICSKFLGTTYYKIYLLQPSLLNIWSIAISAHVNGNAHASCCVCNWCFLVMFRIDELELPQMLMVFAILQDANNNMAGGGSCTGHARFAVDNSWRWMVPRRPLSHTRGPQRVRN